MDDPMFAGLDSAEREIMEREILEGRVTRPLQVPVEHVGKPVKVEPPQPLHSDIRDTRDMRDPANLGENILFNIGRGSGKARATDVADMIDKGAGGEIRRFDPGESTVTETTRRYQQELRERAGAGDKFAISMLTTGKPGDSDE